MPAVEAGVAYVTGAPFYVDGGGANTMRLTFAKESAENITEGVRRLASVLTGKAGELRPPAPPAAQSR
jgi:2-aminoadipate transaminase